MTGWKQICALALALGLAGCGSLVKLPSSPPPALYRLSAVSGNVAPANAPMLNVQLVVDEPNANDALNSRRIAIKDGAFEFKYLPEARWVDNAPRMVQSLLIEGFENSGRIVAVGNQVTGLKPDYILRAELRDFQAEVGAGKPVVRVRLNIKLLRVRDLTVLAFTNVEAQETAASSNPRDLMPAFDSAANKVMLESVAWVFEQIGTSGPIGK